MKILKHKGYTGTIEASIEDGCLFGKILFIDDLITYEGETVEEIKMSFCNAVDRYLAYCEETGKPANKPFSGSFNVRVGQDLHKKAAEIAACESMTLNDFVASSIRNCVERHTTQRIECIHQHNHTFTISNESGFKKSELVTAGEIKWRDRNVAALN